MYYLRLSSNVAFYLIFVVISNPDTNIINAEVTVSSVRYCLRLNGSIDLAEI